MSCTGAAAQTSAGTTTPSSTCAPTLAESEEAVVVVQRARGRDDQAEDRDRGRDGATKRPRGATATQPDDPGGVRRHEQHGDHQPEQVEVPVRRPPPRPRRGGQGVVGEDLGRGRVARLAQGDLVDRGGRPTERRGEPGRDPHHRELDDDECPERPSALRGRCQGDDRTPTLHCSEDTERDDRSGLHEHERAVRGGQVRERARPGSAPTRPRRRRPARSSRAPRWSTGRRRVRAGRPGTTPRTRVSITIPPIHTRGADQVQPERGDGGVVAGGAGGVPLLRERHEADHRDARRQGDHAPGPDGEAQDGDGRRDEHRRRARRARGRCR